MSRPCAICGATLPGPYPGAALQRYEWAFRQRVGSARDKAVLVALAHHDMPHGTGAFPGAARIAAMTEVTERSVRAALRSLQDAGWIDVTRRRQRGRQAANEYRFRQATAACPECGFQREGDSP